MLHKAESYIKSDIEKPIRWIDQMHRLTGQCTVVANGEVILYGHEEEDEWEH